MSGELRAGWDRADITPRHPVALAGFARRAREGPAQEVSAQLSLRTVGLAQGEERAVIMVADLLYWGDDVADRIAEEAEWRFGLPPDHLFLHATHTHSAPMASFRHPPGIGVADSAYVDWLIKQAIGSIERALADQVPVELARGVAPHHLGVDRRAARDSVAARPLDERVQVIALRHRGEAVATLFQHACHPVINHANRVTGDLTGAAMSILEDGGDTGIALYLQGCCGDINPDRYEGTRFRAGDQGDIDATGKALADTVRTVLAGGLTAIAPDLGAGKTVTPLPTQDPPDAAILAERSRTEGPMIAGWATLLSDQPDRASEPATLTLSRLRLAPDLTLLGLSAEPTSPYAAAVHRLAGDTVLTLGYTNGITGYLVTAEQLAQGGYECAEAPYWYGMRGPLLPEAEQVALRAIEGALA